MFDLDRDKAVLATLLIAIIVIVAVAGVYLYQLSFYQVPSYSFQSGNLWAYVGGTEAKPVYPEPRKYWIVCSGGSDTYSNFFWRKEDWFGTVYWKYYGRTDLRLSYGVSGSELVQTFGSWKQNFTDSTRSNATVSTVVETEWWVHRFTAFVYFTIDGSIWIRATENDPFKGHKRESFEFICSTIEEWTRVKDSKVRFRIDAPDVLAQESDFHGLMGMWVRDYNIGDYRAGYSTAYIEPSEPTAEIVLRNENGDPLLWGFPYTYQPEAQANLAYNPSKVIPQYAYFDINVVDFGPIPRWETVWKDGWQTPKYDQPTAKLLFYVDVISTHHKVFSIPKYEIKETPPEAPGRYEPLPKEGGVPSWVIWLVVGVAVAVLVIVGVYFTLKLRKE